MGQPQAKPYIPQPPTFPAYIQTYYDDVIDTESSYHTFVTVLNGHSPLPPQKYPRPSPSPHLPIYKCRYL